MIAREIRALLRGATGQRPDPILQGWRQFEHPSLGRMFTIAPTGGLARTLSEDEAQRYCLMLLDAGVEAIYRDSEPLNL